MAATKTHRYLGCADPLPTAALGDQFEFDEADVWSDHGTNHDPPETKRSVPKLRKPVKMTRNEDRVSVGAKSVPVNVPDWSKILRGEYRQRAMECEDDFGDEEEDGGNDRIPPHEYLAKTRVASFSVHEGVGRTLKGRDLSRVRNAIWKKTGFELD